MIWFFIGFIVFCWWLGNRAQKTDEMRGIVKYVKLDAKQREREMNRIVDMDEHSEANTVFVSLCILHGFKNVGEKGKLFDNE